MVSGLLSLQDNRKEIYGSTVSFTTYKNRDLGMTLDDFILTYDLSSKQEKKLRDCCNFNLKVQEFKVGYLVEKVDMSERQINKIYTQ